MKKQVQQKSTVSTSLVVACTLAVGAGLWYFAFYFPNTGLQPQSPTQLSQNTLNPSVTTTLGPTQQVITENVNEFATALDGSELERISPVVHELPENINPKQLLTYYALGDTYHFALVLRPSINITISGLDPQSYTPKFVGVLIAKKKDEAWRVLADVAVQPAQINDWKPNPYHLWTSEGKLYLSVVDTNGAGSGEGSESVWRYAAKEKAWSRIACVYYQVWGNDQYDYATNTQNFGVQGKQKDSECAMHKVK